MVRDDLLLVLLRGGGGRILIIPTGTGGIVGIVLVVLLTTILVIKKCITCIVVSCREVRSGRTLRVGSTADSTTLMSARCGIVSCGVNFTTCAPSFNFFVSNNARDHTRSRRSIGGIVDNIKSFLGSRTPSFVLVRRISGGTAHDCRCSRRTTLEGVLRNCSSAFAIGFSDPCLFCPLDGPRKGSCTNVLALSEFGVRDKLEHDLPVRSKFVGFISLSHYCSMSEISIDGSGRLILCALRLSTCASSNAVTARRLAVLVGSVRTRCRGNGCYVTNNSFGGSLLISSKGVFKVSNTSCA